MGYHRHIFLEVRPRIAVLFPIEARSSCVTLVARINSQREQNLNRKAREEMNSVFVVPAELALLQWLEPYTLVGHLRAVIP